MHPLASATARWRCLRRGSEPAPHGIDIFHHRIDQMQNDFQVVNHEIEHNTNLRAAIGYGKDDALR